VYTWYVQREVLFGNAIWEYLNVILLLQEIVCCGNCNLLGYYEMKAYAVMVNNSTHCFFSKTNEITAHLNSFTIYISNSIYKHKLSTITQIDNYCKFNIQTQIGDYCSFELYFIRDSLWYWFTQCWANIHSGYISWLSFLSVLSISSCDVCQNNDGICKIAAPMIMFLLIVPHLGY
jgi:hypothetical protein